MRKSAIAALISTFILCACGKPVPAEKSAYVGDWRAENMTLLITQDGRVAYKRMKGTMSTSVEGPLQGFEGDNFLVGVAFFSTTFEVSKAPHQQGSRWKMVVDGVELTKQ